MRSAAITTLALLALATLTAAAGLADTLVLKTDGASQGAVTFQHRAHAMERGVACTRCHHNMATEGTKPCAGCHTLAGAEGVVALEAAYHGQCLGCHKEPPAKTAPPVECAGCHAGAGGAPGADKPTTPPAPADGGGAPAPAAG